MRYFAISSDIITLFLVFFRVLVFCKIVPYIYINFFESKKKFVTATLVAMHLLHAAVQAKAVPNKRCWKHTAVLSVPRRRCTHRWWCFKARDDAPSTIRRWRSPDKNWTTQRCCRALQNGNTHTQRCYACHSGSARNTGAPGTAWSGVASGTRSVNCGLKNHVFRHGAPPRGSHWNLHTRLRCHW